MDSHSEEISEREMKEKPPNLFFTLTLIAHSNVSFYSTFAFFCSICVSPLYTIITRIPVKQEENFRQIVLVGLRYGKHCTSGGLYWHFSVCS